jgi:cytochrome c biogenesis protein CcmG/thiol:disulfide interchange protein DsbE
MALRIIPLALFLLIAGFFLLRLVQIGDDPASGKELPSPLVGKPAPEFELPRLHDPSRTFSNEDLEGKVSLVNVFASWCPSCVHEHPLLVELARSGRVQVYALNYKDRREDALRWLRFYGDPYAAIGFDENGRAGIHWGVYGAPETYVVDKQGIIRKKYIGAITPEKMKGELLPLLDQLQAEAG